MRKASVPLVLLGLLSTAANASNADGACSQVGVTGALSALDSSARRFEETVLRELFTVDAQIEAISPAKTWKRGREEFIAQQRDGAEEAATSIKAYAFGAPVIQCEDREVIVSRRGCQVSRLSDGLMEISQTERIRFVATKSGLKIAQMTSTLDAMRSNGKEIFRNAEFVELKECADAVGNQRK